MTRERTTGWLAVAVAASATGQNAWVTVRTPADLVWGPFVVGVVPLVVMAAAGITLLRGTRSRHGVGAFLAVMAVTEVANLPAQVHFVVAEPDLAANWWNLTTSLGGAVLAVLAVGLLRSSPSSSGGTRPSTTARLLAASGGLLLAAGSLFAWVASVGSPQAGWTPIPLFAGLPAMDAASLLRCLALAGVAVMLAVVRHRGLWVGAALGLLLTQGLPMGIWLDPSWQDGSNVLAPGFWLSLTGQALLALALLLAVWRNGSRPPTRVRAATRGA